MDTIDSNAIHLELKYCERCGALWLRPADSDLIFCSHCSVMLAGLARDPRFRDPLRGPVSDRKTNVMFWSEGGNA